MPKIYNNRRKINPKEIILAKVVPLRYIAFTGLMRYVGIRIVLTK